MRHDLFQFLFTESVLQEEHRALFEDTAATEALKVSKQPLEAALKKLGVPGPVVAFPQWCEIHFDDGQAYREAHQAIFSPDGLLALTVAGWVPAQHGDQAMSGEPAEYKIGFFESPDLEPGDSDTAPDLEELIGQGQENDTTAMDREKDSLNPVENPDAEMGDAQKGVGKAEDGKDPEGTPKGSKNESAPDMVRRLLEMTSTSGVPPVSDGPATLVQPPSTRSRVKSRQQAKALALKKRKTV